MDLLEYQQQNKLVTLLKEKAPIIYADYSQRKIKKINLKLIELRNKYSATKDEQERKNIKDEGNRLKEELKIYTT